METTELIMFIGALLIAFNYLDLIGHLGVLLIIPLITPIAYYARKNPRIVPVGVKSLPLVLRIISTILAWILFVPIAVISIMLAFMLVLIKIISSIPANLNNDLNKVYRNGLGHLGPELFKGIRFLKPNVTDKMVKDGLEQMNIPFIAVVGLVITIIGFSIQILQS